MSDDFVTAVETANALVAEAGGDVWLAFDRLNCGISSTNLKVWTMAALIGQMAEILPGRQAKKLAHRLAGRAMGAAIVVAIAAVQADRQRRA